MDEINFIDTTLRDAHQSLWATRMTTAMMLPIAPIIDQIGFQALDFGGIHSASDSQVIFLRENPFERLRLIAKAMLRTPLSTGFRSNCLNSFEPMPASVNELSVRLLIANGTKRIWAFDALHHFNNISPIIQVAKAEGVEVGVALVYSVSPVHTDEFYAKKATEIVKLGVNYTLIKDPGGLLTPERVRTLVPAILKKIKGLPFEIHSHCTTGLAPLVYLEAIKLGVKTVHTAISPLANGSSQPATENILNNARRLGYSANLNEEALKTMAAHFRYVAKREGLPIGVPAEYNLFYYDHQLPGGMISNLKFMLTQMGMGHRLEEVLEEIALVRKELAYPIMVTPFSQIIGTLATLNIALGERYKVAPDEAIKYAMGFYGELPFPIEKNVMDRIMGLPRAKDFINWEPPQVTIKDLRRKFGDGISDEELLLRTLYREEHIKALLAAGPIKTEYPRIDKPVVALIQELGMRRNLTHVRIQKEDFSLTLQKSVH